MLPVRTLMTLSALCLLAGCGGLISADLPPPPSLTTPCPTVAALPDRALTMTEIEVYWGRDRGSLRQCESQHSALVQWVQKDDGLSKIEQKEAIN
jgi:hypothetical protein